MTEPIQSNNKRIAKNTFLLYIRTFFVTIISLYTSRVVLNTLGVEDFGIYNVVGGIVAMMAVLNTAITSSTQRYLAYELGREDTIKLRNVFCTCINIYAILSGLLLILAESVGLWFLNNQLVIPVERLTATNYVFQISVFTCINSLLFSPYNSMIIANERMDFISYVSIADAFMKLGIVYLLTVSPFDKLICYSSLLLIESLLYTSVCRILCLRKFSASRYVFYWNYSLFREILMYTGWNFLGAISVFIQTQGINILLNMFFNPVVNAARGIAYQVNNALMQFFNGFIVAVTPQITKSYAKKDWEEFFKLVMRSSKYSFFLILFCSLPVFLEAPFVIHLWLGQVPDYVVPFFRLIIIITAIDALSFSLTSVINANGNIKENQILVSMITLLNIPISYLFLKQGEYSPTIVYVISLCLSFACLLAKLYGVGRLMPFPFVRYFKEVILRILFVTVLSFGVSQYVQSLILPTFYHSFLIIMLTVVFSLLLILFVGIDKKERVFIMNVVKDKIRKL